jgi:hypothetical protein
MLMKAGEMEEVSIEVCGYQLHDSFSLADCGHEIALAAQLRVEADVVAVLVLALEEAGIEKNVGAG